MKTLTISFWLSTGLLPQYSTPPGTIEVDDDPIGQGGFGVVYRARRIDGRPSAPLVIKVLLDSVTGSATRGFATIQELQRRLAARHSDYVAQGSTLGARHPGLLGVPQFSFSGTLDRQAVIGYAAIDLTAEGMESLGAVLEDDAKTLWLQSRPLHVRLRMALQLVDAFDLLSTQLHYIHADLKAEAVFIDLKRPRCALIDFDSGAAARDLSDTPSTFGTKQDWLAPEIVRQLDHGGNTSRVIKVNLYSDIWSVNVGVHYVLLGCHPLFFLSELSERSLRAYSNKYQWPDAQPSFQFFQRDYLGAYRAYLDCLETLPPDVLQRLAFTINHGYWDPSRRTTYGQWKAVLTSVNRPAIQTFSADRTAVTDLRPVHLAWQVTGAAALHLSGVGDVTGRSCADVAIRQDTTFTLSLTSDDGGHIAQTVHLAVSKTPPLVQAFDVQPSVLTRAVPARLSWRVIGAERIEIDHGVGDVTHRSHVDVLPKRDMSYTLTAVSPFGVRTAACADLRVSSLPPIIRQFTADRAELVDDPTVELAWEVSDDAQGIAIDPLGAVEQRGRRRISQTRDTEYVLTATSHFGRSTEARLRINVSKVPPLIRTFTVTPVCVRADTPVEIAWEVTGAVETEITPVGSGLPLSGTRNVRLAGSSRLTIVARSCFGVATSRSVDVDVLVPTALQVRQTPLPPVTSLTKSAAALTRTRTAPASSRTPKPRAMPLRVGRP